ncbi:pheromone A receptor-domain-containing protein [Mycena floridula]|nr:pheromone A receptor-domain-containing protein [Mycena floridula]
MIAITGYPPNWLFSVISFICFVLCMIPLRWHLEAWNTGTCLYMIWTGLGCLNMFINSVIWNGNAINWAPVWCDISSRFLVGVTVAIPCASLCINRRLYKISSANAVTVSKAEKRRAVMVDLAIGVGIPIIQMILQYTVAGHRFDIYEDFGCYPATYNTPVAYPVVIIWPIVIGLVSAVYCFMSIRAFSKRRAQFNELLSSTNNLNSNRYFRLMCLAGIDALFTVPLATWAMVNNIQSGVSPWKGWADTHWGYSAVHQFPAIIWQNVPHSGPGLEISRWFFILCALVFFAFFGFADEARKNYRAMFTSVAKRVGYTTATTSTFNSSSNGSQWKPNSTNGRGGNLPVFIRKETTRTRDSLDSFDNMTSSYNEKSFIGDASFGALTLNDVGGTLAYKDDSISPISSSGSSTSSVFEKSPEEDIEISSVRRMSAVSITRPQPALAADSVRHPVDVPISVEHMV